MMRLLIYAILFYIIWKFIRVFIKYLSTSRKENPDINSGREGQAKYKNIEDAKYTEINDEDKGKDKD